MKTIIKTIDKNSIDIKNIGIAADILKSGGLVAFPTETVYGLGANALDEKAVSEIFVAKGRPSDNPLIVHVCNVEMVKRLVKNIPELAFKLMEKFWPGPLTLIMEKSSRVPEIITAGLSTVAIRMPSHPIALKIIEESQVPVAAPSANISGKPSPTEAKHVIEDLMGKVELIIDGGSSQVGLESTVLDVTVNPPMILRPGGITKEQLEEAVGKIDIDKAILSDHLEDIKPRAPGMKYTHYSPKADVIIIEGKVEACVEKIRELAESYKRDGIPVGILATEQTKGLYTVGTVMSLGDRKMPDTIASSLFRELRHLDDKGVRVILAEAIEDTGVGLAVMNRMKKAAGYNIIKVGD
ncbi:L-threonylcarbamoyladenylate synthase [Pseudobacteroides cellulosolvens]|uniref:Threonylcarbamoyl-AMP synthase n=1 Tax=Pseudobacteroides cellulosolvens ATCC 35603 = DSM 2933 TaxID=398512 RepID=A0A0L6JS01_9FIRM|nr:L-threonylcarbamoyladenylate synthase [Pseudobacteroides cellulosolvens]KNY28524.1 Sua5/YciO/YrdC/YwlC family protein [Pseudobacteroides cellulosolvens ATCC 35603 = DSM 2933]